MLVEFSLRIEGGREGFLNIDAIQTAEQERRQAVRQRGVFSWGEVYPFPETETETRESSLMRYVCET